MENMDITSAKYTDNNDPQSVEIVVDGVTMYVPLDPDNTQYAEIMRQVKAGTLTIVDAD